MNVLSMSNDNSLYLVLKPQLYVTHFFGVSPFKLGKNGPEASRFLLFWTAGLTLILLGCSLFSLAARASNNYGLIMKIGDAISVYLNVASMFFVLLYAGISRKTVMHEIENIFNLDKQFQAFKYIDLNKSYTMSKKWVNIVNTLLMIYLTAELIYNVALYGKHSNVVLVGEIIAYSLPTIISTIMELHFCTLILIIKRRYNWINLVLLEMTKSLKQDRTSLNNRNTKTRKQTCTYEVVKMIRNTRIFHQDLCTISKQLNKAFSIQILMLITTAFLNIVVTLFYWAAYSSLPKKENGSRIYGNSRFTLSVLQILSLILVCSTTTAEAKRTASLIHDIIPAHDGYVDKRVLKTQLSSFSLQLVHYNINFNACGIFLINEALLYAIVGAASSYLVIIIQFELLSSQTNNHN